MDERTEKNYLKIVKNIMNYLPSRILILLNSIIIIPIFAHVLDAKQMSIFLLAIQVLNIILTCSFDWISKAVLRFHEKYRHKNELDDFISNIFWISIIAYAIIFVSYFLFKDFVLTKYAIDNLTFLLTIILVIPCGIRQFLYQILRIQNDAKLYTLSILLYQFGFIALFLSVCHIFPSASAIISAMIIAIFAIDFYIMRTTKLKYNIQFKMQSPIVAEVLKYALPLIFTNSCYWYILNISKFMFQNQQEYLSTAIIGTSWILANSLTPFMAIFMFTFFPVIVKKFELNKQFKLYYTNLVQLYCFIFIPIISLVCYYSKEITSLILPQSYAQVAYVLPFFAISCFLHEFVKLINIKYHLKIKTYIEMLVAGIIAGLAYFLNIGLISKYALMGAGLALFATELTLIFVNILIGNKNLDYINYKSIAKTFFVTTFAGFVCYCLLSGLECNYISKITLYVCLIASFNYLFRKRILA